MQFLHGYTDIPDLGEYEEQGFFAENGLSGIEVPAYTTDLLTMTNSGVTYGGYGTPAYTTDLLDASNIGGSLSDYNQVPLVSGMHGFFDKIKKAVVGGGKKTAKKAVKGAKKQAVKAATAEVKKQVTKATGVNTSNLNVGQAAQALKSPSVQRMLTPKAIKSIKAVPTADAIPMDNTTPPTPAPAPASTDDSSTGMMIGLGVAAVALAGGAFWYMNSKKQVKTSSRKNPKKRYSR